MVDNTIALKVQKMGAENVRNRLREITNELRAGKPATKELGKEMKELSTQVNAQSRIVKLNERAWQESHRTLSTAGRIMSTVGSIARSALAVTTAWSVASLAFGKTNSSIAETEADLARAHRELIAAIESGDPEKQAEAQENINVLKTRLMELKDQDLEGLATAILNTGASIALMGSSAVAAIPKLRLMIPQLAATATALTGLGVAGWIALGPILLLIALIAGIAAALYMIITPGDQIADFFDTFFPGAGDTVREFGRTVDDVFTMHIPNAFIFMANSALAVFDSVVLGAEGMVNGVISGINAIISAVNAVASFLRLPTIAAIPTVSFAGITGGRIDYLGSRNAGGGSSRGAGAGDSPAFATVTRGGRGGGNTVVINNTFNGDVSGEEMVDKTMKALKDRMREVEFTGFQ